MKMIDINPEDAEDIGINKFVGNYLKNKNNDDGVTIITLASILSELLQCYESTLALLHKSTGVSKGGLMDMASGGFKICLENLNERLDDEEKNETD